jgi:cell division protein FtsL
VGVAARKIAYAAAPARPALRVATGGRSRSRSAASRQARAVGLFRVCVICVALLAIAGLARVSLAAEAAAAAIDAWELQGAVKAERQEVRTLEADRSALASPSRIEVLACETLNMSRPEAVGHLALPETAREAVVVAEAPGAGTARDASIASEVMATLADLAAGEAQVLLVGDMGLGIGQ